MNDTIIHFLSVKTILLHYLSCKVFLSSFYIRFRVLSIVLPWKQSYKMVYNVPPSVFAVFYTSYSSQITAGVKCATVGSIVMENIELCIAL